MTEEKSKFEIYFVSNWQQVIDIVGQSSGVEVPMEWLERALANELGPPPYLINHDNGYQATLDFWPLVRNESRSLEDILVLRVYWCISLEDPKSQEEGVMAFAFSDQVKAMRVSDSTIIREM